MCGFLLLDGSTAGHWALSKYGSCVVPHSRPSDCAHACSSPLFNAVPRRAALEAENAARAQRGAGSMAAGPQVCLVSEAWAAVLLYCPHVIIAVVVVGMYVRAAARAMQPVCCTPQVRCIPHHFGISASVSSLATHNWLYIVRPYR